MEENTVFSSTELVLLPEKIENPTSNVSLSSQSVIFSAKPLVFNYEGNEAGTEQSSADDIKEFVGNADCQLPENRIIAQLKEKDGAIFHQNASNVGEDAVFNGQNVVEWPQNNVEESSCEKFKSCEALDEIMLQQCKISVKEKVQTNFGSNSDLSNATNEKPIIDNVIPAFDSKEIISFSIKEGAISNDNTNENQSLLADAGSDGQKDRQGINIEENNVRTDDIDRPVSNSDEEALAIECDDEDVACDVLEDEENEENKIGQTLINRQGGENYRTVILDDWCADGPATDPFDDKSEGDIENTLTLTDEPEKESHEQLQSSEINKSPQLSRSECEDSTTANEVSFVQDKDLSSAQEDEHKWTAVDPLDVDDAKGKLKSSATNDVTEEIYESDERDLSNSENYFGASERETVEAYQPSEQTHGNESDVDTDPLERDLMSLETGIIPVGEIKFKVNGFPAETNQFINCSEDEPIVESGEPLYTTMEQVPLDEGKYVMDVVHTFPSEFKESKTETEPVTDVTHSTDISTATTNMPKPKSPRRISETKFRCPISSKELILAMELTQKVVETKIIEGTDFKRAEIIGILESEQVGDWRKPLPSSALTGAGSLERAVVIPIETVQIEKPQTPIASSIPSSRGRGRGRTRSARPASTPKPKVLVDRDTERALALQQLASEFMDGGKKRRSKGSSNAPAVAASDLGRALASTPVLTGKRKRPCYQPGNTDGREGPGENKPDPIAKSKSKIPDSSITTKAEKKEGTEKSPEGVTVASEPKDHTRVKTAKRTPRELQQLLGDEGAVRMIYDTAQKDAPQKVFKKTKKGLKQQSKFVEDTVMRLSGAAEKTLRGKRLKQSENEAAQNEEVLFPAAEQRLPESTQTSQPFSDAVPLVKRPKKKKMKSAEASRILYRHSSSESFDGSEGLKRSNSEIAALDQSLEVDKMSTCSAIKIESTSPQRKSSRPRKVSTKLLAYVSKPFTSKKVRKPEEVKETVLPDEATGSIGVKSEDAKEKESTTSAPPIPLLSPATTSPTPAKSSRPSTKKLKENVRVTCTEGLIILTLTSQKPGINNVLTHELMSELRHELVAADIDVTCKAVLLATEGPVFCQGVDISELGPGSDVSLIINSIKSLVSTLVCLEKPTIIGVQGAAMGLGVALLPLCDMVIASDAATFSTPYARLGQGLEAAASYTFPLTSKLLVNELIYKGNVLSAQQALEAGLISQVIPASQFTTQLSEIAHVVAAQPPQGLRYAKNQMCSWRREKIQEAMERECTDLLAAWTSAEWLAAAADYLASGELLMDVR